MTANGGRRLLRLHEVATLEMGETLIAKDLTGDGIPVYSAGRDLAPWGYTSHSRKSFRKGTIVVGARGSIGYPRLPPDERFVSTQTTIAVTPGPEVLPEFLYYALTAVDYAAISAQQAVPMLTIGAFREVELRIPPMEQQREVAKVLSAVDGSISASQEKTEALGQLKTALLRDLLEDAA